MYQWYVIRIEDNLYDWQFNAMAAPGARMRTYTMLIPESGQEKADGLEANANLFAFRNEESADAALMFLTERYPYNSYAKVEAKKVARRSPGELTFGVFNEEGLVPA